jgi:hypothetical protein
MVPAYPSRREFYDLTHVLGNVGLLRKVLF